MSILRRFKSSDAQARVNRDAVLALDIGSEFVKALIAVREKDGSLTVVGAGRARQDSGNMYAGAIADIPAVIEVCERALSRAENEAGFTAKTTVVGIAGELVKGETSTVRYHRENGNKPISDAEMSAIVKKVQDSTEIKAQKEVAIETNNPKVEVRLINSAIVALNIDGYKISNPIGFKGSEVSIQFYTAFAPLIHVAAIEKVCAELDLELLAIAVEPFAVCRACLGDDTSSDFSGIVMDIGGGTTDLAVVNDGGVEGTKMFSIGGRSFTRQLSEALGVDFATAERYKLNLDNPKLDDHLKAKITSALQRNLSVWLAGVEIALEDFSPTNLLPSRVLLCGGGAGLSELQEALATTDWYKKLPFAKRPLIHLIDPEDVVGIKNRSKINLDYSFITALGLLRVAIDTIDGSSEDHPLKTRITKLLQK